MERIAIAGLSLRETDLQGLERVARLAGPGDGAFVRELADLLAVSEAVLLSTCNRVELVFAREAGHLPCRADLDSIATGLGLPAGDPLRGRMHLECGRDAARRLFGIACSLDSLVVGEDQILTQVREAFARAEELGLAGRLLGPLFRHALQVGKEARARTGLSRHPVSVVSIAASRLAERFRGRTGALAAPRIAILGAGRMARLVATSLRDSGFPPALVVNRSPEPARALAAGHGAGWVSLEEFRRGAEAVDALVSTTASPGWVLDRAALLALAARTPAGSPLFALDLAVPRDLEPVQDPSVEIVDLEALRAIADRNRARRAAAADQARVLIERKLEVYGRRFAETALAGAIEELRGESAAILERELASLSSGRLARLSEADRHAVERWARAAFGRLSHVPIATLKGFAEDLASRDDRDEAPTRGSRGGAG